LLLFCFYFSLFFTLICDSDSHKNVTKSGRELQRSEAILKASLDKTCFQPVSGYTTLGLSRADAANPLDISSSRSSSTATACRSTWSRSWSPTLRLWSIGARIVACKANTRSSARRRKWRSSFRKISSLMGS